MTDWFRSWHGAPTDPKWLGIAKRVGVAPGIVAAVAWALMDRASQSTDRGSIEGYDADGMGCFFGCEADQINAIVVAMTDKGMLIDGRFQAWERRQPKREDFSTERVQAHRERNATQTKRGVTQRNAPDTDTDTDKKKEVERAQRAARLPDDWKPSREDFEYARQQGLSPQAINLEAEKFRNHWRAKGGRDAAKLDWSATWRNWVLRSSEMSGRKPPEPSATSPPPDWSARAGYFAKHGWRDEWGDQRSVPLEHRHRFEKQEPGAQA